MSDVWADTEFHFPGDSSSEAGTNLFGCFKQLYLLKKANRHLKVLLSIGGASYSTNFAAPASTISGRSTFASTAVSLVKNLGLDGLDIDWEFPANDVEALNMVLLLKATRDALDSYGNSLSTPYHFQLTVASPGGPVNYQTMHLAEMDQYVDFWNIMTFDYAGPWSTVAANQANLFPSQDDPTGTPYNTQTAINYYLLQGISAKKLILGMPIYGRTFTATDGIGKPFQGVGKGTWEAGIYEFKMLPQSGAIEVYNNVTGSSYSYDAGKRELVSYDSIKVAKQKAAFIQQMGLGGAMWWESSADRAGESSLIQNVVEIIGGEDGSSLEKILNELDYSNSTYDNLRDGMRGVPSTASTKSAVSDTCTPISSTFGLISSIKTPSSDILSSRSISTPMTAITASTFLTSPSQGGSSSEAGVSKTTAVSSQLTQSTPMNLAMVPGKNGVPGCAYVLASNFADAQCSFDYCNCGGTVAPLLTSSVSGTLTSNCNYPTQPAVNSCALHFNSSTTTTKALSSVKLVYVVCPASFAVSDPCKTVSTAFSTASA